MKNLLTLFGLTTFMLLFSSSQVLASHSYNEGNFPHDDLIDNAVFRDYTSLTKHEIQDFLDSIGGDIASRAWNGRTSARVIEDAAYDYGINPKVIISTLQKEQSLITDKDPASWQYDSAMGYGCPTSGGCNSKYAGFEKQVDNGTWQLRINYERANGNDSWWDSSFAYLCANPSTYYDNGLFPGNTVGFTNSNGTVYRTVTIANAATASLYCYTPHAYNTDSPVFTGSYNFVVSFEHWFGSRSKALYRAETHHRCCHRYSLRQNTVYGEMWFKNIGNVPWYDQVGLADAPAGTRSVRLYASRDIGRASIFGKYWNTNRTVAAYGFSAVYESDGETLADDQHVAEPGQIVKYEAIPFRVQSNTPFGKHKEFLQPGLKGKKNAFNDPGAFLNIHVEREQYKAETYKRCCHRYAERQNTVYGEMWFKNAGNVPWYDHTGVKNAPKGTNEVRLYTGREVARDSIFSKYWPKDNIAALNFSAVYESDGETLASNQHKAKPGQIVQYEAIPFRITTKTPYGKHKEFLQPVVFRNPQWFNDPGAFLNIHALEPGS